MEEVENIGIGERDSERLMEVGILTPNDLIRLSATAKAREAISIRTGIPAGVLMRYRNQADLARVKGLGKGYLQMLQAVGVHSVKALAESAPSALTEKLQRAAVVLSSKRTPTERQVAAWIESARELPSILKTES